MATLQKHDDNIIHLHHEDNLDSLRTSLSGHGPRHEAEVEVDRDDDLASLRSKLEASRAPRIVLTVPSNAKILREGLEYRVLRRLQRELGVELILVIGDSGRRAMAKENGFAPVYSSTSGYHRSRAPVSIDNRRVSYTDPDEFKPALSIGKMGILVGALLLSLVAVIGYVALPEATVTVYAEPQSLARDVEVVVEIGGPPMDVAAQRLSGRFAEANVTVEDKISLSEAPSPAGPSAFQSGSQVTMEAREALRTKLMDQARQKILTQLKAALPANHSLPEATIRTEVVSEKYDHEIGDSTNSLSGSLEVKGTGLGFSNENFNKLVTSIWSQEVPRNFQAVDGLKLTPPAVVSAEARHATLRVRASGMLQPDLNTDALVNAVRGHSVTEATRSLAGTAVGVRPPGVAIWPEWADKAYRVSVQMAADASKGTVQAPGQVTR